jgi:DNA invertase Pin-like site-specific DNA recombinase
MTNAIRYHRYSTKKQDKGSSLERQNEATGQLCEASGWTIVETLEDKGQSAWKGDHLSAGNLGTLRKRIDAGMIPAGTRLVVENLDRLSRQDYRTARRWIEDVTDHGIVVEVCRPRLTLDSAAMSGANIAAMLQHLLEANRATEESARKSGFQKINLQRMNDMMRDGICPTPRVPAWLHGVVGEPLTVLEDRAALVRLIYEWSASGLGLQSICQKLNADHAPWTGPGWRSGDVKWQIGYVRDILKTPAVEGKYAVKGADRKPNGEVITGYYPRIVDADLVNRARAAIAGRAGTGGAKAGEAMNFFQGLMVCRKCGGAVGRVTGGNGYAYMLCRNSRYGTCDNRSGMPYNILSKVVVDHLLHLALDDSHFIAVDAVAPLQAKVSGERSRIETLNTEQANLIQVLRQLPTSTAIISELGRIEGQLAEAQVALATAEKDLAAARGTVTPNEHLERVRTVRDSLDTDAEARRMVRDALPVLINAMTWDGQQVVVTSPHFFMRISRDGELSGFDLHHPGRSTSHPDYRRRRAEAIEAGEFMPLVGGTVG